MKMRCIIADDEPLARKGMENLIMDVPFLELVGLCSDAFEVLETLHSTEVDLLFLDIQMPKISGISLIKNGAHLPATIITTAFPDYAVESYELAVIDYLMKPISFERFFKAVNKAKDYYELSRVKQSNIEIPDDFCFIKCEKSFERLFYRDIQFVEAMLNYVIIHTDGGKYISYLTLKSVEEQLPSNIFIKINKSFIVNHQKIKKIEGNEILIGNIYLQIGKTFKESVIEMIVNGKLLKR